MTHLGSFFDFSETRWFLYNLCVSRTKKEVSSRESERKSPVVENEMDVKIVQK